MRQRLGNLNELNDLLYNDQEFREEMHFYTMNDKKPPGYGYLHSILGGYNIEKCQDENSLHECKKLYCACYHDFNYIISERLFRIYWRLHDEYINSIDTIIVDKKTIPEVTRFMLRYRELIVELENNKLTLGTLHKKIGGYYIKSCGIEDCNKSSCGYYHDCSNQIPQKLADIYFDIHKKFNKQRNENLRINYNKFLDKKYKEYAEHEKSIQEEIYISKLEKELDSANLYIQDKTERWEADSKYIIDLQNDLRELKRQNVSFQIQLINLTGQIENKDNLIAKLSEKINHQSEFDQYRQTNHYQTQLNEYQMSNHLIQPRENIKRQRYE
jgi:hypothetical protein